MTQTKIEWTDWTVNPIRAEGPEGQRGHYCEKISPGCQHCYASRLQPRFRMQPFPEQRPRSLSLRMDARTLEAVLRRRKPTRIFWCDMTDMFGEWVPIGWIAACFGVMAATPQHTHQVLTKRAKRMCEVITQWPADPRWELAGAADAVTGGLVRVATQQPWPLPNVWLGVSAEDQQRADERIPHLLATPAAVRFVSAEPLLGPLDLTHRLGDVCTECSRKPQVHLSTECPAGYLRRGIDWVIVGGESGHGARPCDVEWLRSIVKQCADAGVACFVKQLGANFEGGIQHRRKRDRKGGDPAEWPEDLRVREWPVQS